MTRMIEVNPPERSCICRSHSLSTVHSPLLRRLALAIGMRFGHGRLVDDAGGPKNCSAMGGEMRAERLQQRGQRGKLVLRR